MAEFSVIPANEAPEFGRAGHKSGLDAIPWAGVLKTLETGKVIAIVPPTSQQATRMSAIQAAKRAGIKIETTIEGGLVYVRLAQ